MKMVIAPDGNITAGSTTTWLLSGRRLSPPREHARPGPSIGSVHDLGSTELTPVQQTQAVVWSAACLDSAYKCRRDAVGFEP